MESPLPRALLLLFLLGCTTGEGRRYPCRLDPYRMPMLDDPKQCPGRLDASGTSSSPPDPGTASADNPAAEETSRPWALLSGVSAGEISRSPTKGSKDAGLVPVQAEQCHKWIQGQVTPVETFQCPTEPDHPADIFCCGTCTTPYCCSSPKDHLDQTSCSRVMEEMEDQGAGEISPEDPCCTAWEGRRDTNRLDPYGAPLLDDLMQCPAHLNVSGASSLHRAQTSPMGRGKAGAGDPSAEESYSWTMLSGVSAGEISRLSAEESTDAGVLLMEGEQCNKWVHGKASPVETFPCPTQHNQQDMFCCGTCTASYCCSSTKERLDQASCSKIIKKTEDHRAVLFAVAPHEKSTNNIRLVLAVIGVACICVWIAMVVSYFQDEKIPLNQQRPSNEGLDVECEHAASRQAASGNPDPSS